MSKLKELVEWGGNSGGRNVNYKQIIVGVAIFMAGLWGGCYMFYHYGTTWFGFPSVLTAAILFAIGVFVAGFGIKI